MLSARKPVLFSLMLCVFSCGSEQKTVQSPKAGGDEAPTESGLSFKTDCVDPVSEGGAHDPTRPFDKRVQLDVHTEDLEGDGVVDEFVMPAWSCGISCNRSAYVMRGTCGHYVGTFPTTDKYGVLEHKTNGLKDIDAHPRRIEEDGNLHCYQVIWAFDGTIYKESKRRECECKDENAKCTAWP